MDSFELNCVREFVAEFPTTDWQDYGEGGIGAMQTFIRDLLDQHDADQREIARLRASVGDAVTVWEQSATRMYKRLRCVLGGALRYRKRIKALEDALGELWESFDTTDLDVPPRTMSALLALREVYDRD